MTHQVIQDLENRYTTKQYDKNKKISQQDMATLTDALVLSASSINSQPWKFIVLESDEAKQRFDKTFANKFQFNQRHATEASHIILFAHKTHYNRDDYEKVVDKGVADGRTKPEEKEAHMGAYAFVEINSDEQGFNGDWTKSQAYIALGNALHIVARMGIDSTTMEGIDSELVGEAFADQLDGYECHVALAVGYRDAEADYNRELPKSRLDKEELVATL